MGCGPFICGSETYTYVKEQNLLNQVMSEFSNLAYCYSHDFVINCHKNMFLKPDIFLLRYQKKIEIKQTVPHTILQKWKLILYATNVENEHYADCIGFDKHFQEQRIASKTYRFSKQNPFEIRLQDLYFHESYKQIEKDAGRVYLVPQIKQDFFQKLLKKIANHFPQSGYCLGINYIIGYFLLVGMSQMDSFWMFVHLALNEKFLALGFFQNDLPLTKVIIEIFKNILRRKNKELYEYIYKHLEVDDASWILKWITSFYLSTFPIQFCHYILDYVFSFGVLGLAVVAYATVNFFERQILKCDQSQDFSQTLKYLLNFQHFEKEVPIKQFMSSVYEVSLTQRDFQFLSQAGDNFYVKYFTLYSEWRFKRSQESRQMMNQLLSEWYSQIIQKREAFAKFGRSFDGKFYTQNKDNSTKVEQKEIPISQKSQVQTNKNGNIDAVIEHKIEEKPLQNSQIQKEIQKKQENKPDQSKTEEQITNLNRQRARTILVSSRHRKSSGQSSSFQDQSQSEKEGFQIDFPLEKQSIKKPKSQEFLNQREKRADIKTRRIRSQRRIGLIRSTKLQTRQMDKKQITSIKSFTNVDNVSQGEVRLDFKPLSKQLSLRNHLSKTLPLRKHSDNLNSAAYLELRNFDGKKTFFDLRIEDADMSPSNENIENIEKDIENAEKKKEDNVSKNENECVSNEQKDQQIENIWAGHQQFQVNKKAIKQQGISNNERIEGFQQQPASKQTLYKDNEISNHSECLKTVFEIEHLQAHSQQSYLNQYFPSQTKQLSTQTDHNQIQSSCPQQKPQLLPQDLINDFCVQPLDVEKYVKVEEFRIEQEHGS